VAYADWADIQSFLDKAPGLTERDKLAADAATLQGFSNVVETLFENEVRGFLAVPVNSTASPDTFKVAKAICALRGAVMALEYLRQTQSTDLQEWYPKWLGRQAEKLVEQLKTAAAKPVDAQTSSNPIVVIPIFSGLPEKPIFTTRRDRRECNDGPW
jgi:hypothetical protein